ncbi:MAG: IS4 family transposase [Ignavibacteriaceae bacterium]|nr:IS4 family transposase [Ignavibacteriaceae bacterium]
MNKNKKNSGNPVISQIINLLDRDKINRTARENESDRYYKRFKTIDHLITMVSVVLSGCNSLRDIAGIILACEGKINHLGLKYFPKRSTISDANRKRKSKVFSDIYFGLYHKYRKIISDSRLKDAIIKKLLIVDSTTISLFCDILKGVGRNPISGKKKGGIKMHTMINASEDVPTLVRFSSAATHDHTFLKDLELKKGSIVVFDKGYNDYKQYSQWNLDGIYFVTRQKDNAVWKSMEEFEILEETDNGVLKDEKIQIGKPDAPIELRRIAYWSEEHKKVYEFICNNYDLPADKIAEIYKRRWQIELLFKRLKQNFQLKYFLGDTQNAIEIQIWVSLIVQLLILVIQKQAERKWAYSNLVSVIRFHLMTYIDLLKFIESPDSGWACLKNKSEEQMLLFD